MENEYEPIDLGNMKEVRDEEVMFVEKGYLKLPSNFKLRHDIRTGPRAFKQGFPNPEATHMEDGSGFEYLVYRWKKSDLDAYDERCKELVEEPQQQPEQEVHIINSRLPSTALQGLDEKDIARMQLNEPEATTKNVESLHILAHNQKIREQKANNSMLPNEQARDQYFLNIVDRDFARQVPIDPEHLKDQVMKYRVMDEAELGQVLDRLQESGTANQMGDGRWFFKSTVDIPVQEEEQEPEDTTDTPEDADPNQQDGAVDSPTIEEEQEELEEIEEEEPIEEESPEDPGGELVEEEEEETEQTQIKW